MTVSRLLARVVRLSLLSVLLVVSGNANAQQFRLGCKGSHYYVFATICKEKVSVMLESGIPAFLIGKDFYMRCLKDGTNLRFEESKSKIRLMNNIYDVELKAEGLMRFGEAVYDGPIWILKDFGDDMRVPFQYLRSSHGEHVPITISFKEGYMRMGNGEVGPEGKQYQMGIDKSTGCPTVAAQLGITTPKGKVMLDGTLDIDFGNPMLIALFESHDKMSEAIKKGKIEVRDARDKNGNVVAKGIFAEEITLLDKDYKEKSIILLPSWGNKKILGLLGLPFFDKTVTFDFGRHKVIVN